VDVTDVVPLKRTILHFLATELGARHVPFAGYEMPLQFAHGIRHEHLHTRRAASLFDVSHMGQIRVRGPDSLKRLEGLVPGDLSALAPWQQRYTLFLRGDGGILDDLMITRLPDGWWLVVNAARKQHDLEYLRAQLGSACEAELLGERALLALQGPESARLLGELCPDAARLAFMHGGEFDLAGSQALIHRCGYTGEDGFEISVANRDAERIARLLLSRNPVQPVGLGARDTLRLEAGLCLYGHDIDESTSPVEAGLAWAIAPKYRNGVGRNAAFPGSGVILKQLRDGPVRRRVGIRSAGQAPLRAGTKLLDGAGVEVGAVTSGSYGFSVGAPVAMAYVKTACAQAGTVLQALRRDGRQAATVCALPFIPHRYYKPKAERESIHA
jgi:aminomethyltransferase